MLEKKNLKLKLKTNAITNSTHKHETFRDKHKKCGRYFYKKVQTLLGYICGGFILIFGKTNTVM